MGGDPNHKIILLLLYNCNFATVMNCNVNIFGDRGLPKGSQQLVYNMSSSQWGDPCLKTEKSDLPVVFSDCLSDTPRPWL